eukprot:TRINITY_DN1360_c2_g1_i1.p2 TRINITY_DN1360_c2_g1~~TRINITY_DN1360_c2_g1_i1.p2  ORF type:complete len:160 (-),score=30.81 TRINITY_DN1360_c2_g1_i1:24-446(-)
MCGKLISRLLTLILYSCFWGFIGVGGIGQGEKVLGTKIIQGVGKWTLLPNLWKVRNIKTTCEQGIKKMQVFWGNSETEVEELVENGDGIQFCGWNNLLEGNSNNCLFFSSPQYSSESPLNKIRNQKKILNPQNLNQNSAT